MSHTYKHERKYLKVEDRRLLEEETRRRIEYLNWVYYLNHYHQINQNPSLLSRAPLTTALKRLPERRDFKESGLSSHVNNCKGVLHK